MVYDLFLLLFAYSPTLQKFPSVAVFTTILTEISYTKNKKKMFLNFKIYLGAGQKHSEGRMRPAACGLKTADVAGVQLA
jgi:hypothetical protein